MGTGPALLLLPVLAAVAQLGHGAVLPRDLGLRDTAGCAFDSGQVYCQSVGSITYSNLGKSGSYNEVTGMDMETGTCTWSPVSFSGPLAPFDQPVRTKTELAWEWPASAWLTKARRARAAVHPLPRARLAQASPRLPRPLAGCG